MDATFLILLAGVAFLYAGVGHGGASGYLALMALYAFPMEVMKPTALLLNLFVSLTAFIQFHRGRHFDAKTFWPFALASVPMAFLGGWMQVDASLYRSILGVLLLVPVARFLLLDDHRFRSQRAPDRNVSLLVGGAVGFLSGLIGIGGGILLSPILIMLGWANQKQAAALSAAFIFVNSVSGLAGQFAQGAGFNGGMLLPVAVAFAGGLAGSWLGAHRLNGPTIRRMLGIVLLVAALKLLLS